MSKFVHFMNTFILVPPQKLIIQAIVSINKIIQKLNKPFNSLHELKIGHTFVFGHSFGKIFGKELAFRVELPWYIQPFKPIIPYNMIPEIPNLSYKCIDEPEGYKTVFNFSTPIECKKRNTNRKKRTLSASASDSFSSKLSNFIFILILLLLLLLYIGNKDSIHLETKGSTYIEKLTQVLPFLQKSPTVLPAMNMSLPAVLPAGMNMSSLSAALPAGMNMSLAAAMNPSSLPAMNPLSLSAMNPSSLAAAMNPSSLSAAIDQSSLPAAMNPSSLPAAMNPSSLSAIDQSSLSTVLPAAMNPSMPSTFPISILGQNQKLK